jgi:hypothetical protein
MRRLLVLVVVLAAALFGLDRLAAFGAERTVAHRLQVDQNLGVAPDVHIGGFPFLTQALRGDYREVSATVRDVRRDNLTITRVTARLYGVHVPLSSVIRQSVHSLPTDRADGEVELSYADVNAYLADRGLRVAPAPDGQVRITGKVSGVDVSAAVGVRVSGEDVVLGGDPVSVTLHLPQLPFGARLVSARATTEGLLVSATAKNLVVRAP